MSKINLTKKFFISFVFIFLVFFMCNKNFSNADFTTAEFIEAVKGVYEMAHNNHYAYGNTGTLPPCEDGLIACDRLIARALWDLGVQDQPAGGMTIPIMDEFLTTHGFAKYTNQDEIMPGDIILLNDVKGNTEINAHWHTFVIVTYDKTTGMCTKYDTGSGGRIEAIQPFSVPLFEPGYENRDLVAIYRWTGKLGNIGNLSKLLDQETWNYLVENTDISEGKPDTYDIFIDEADLDQDDGMEIPVIQTSLDYVLYNNDYLSNIDFFKTNSFDNKATLKHIDETLQNQLKTTWERISNLVKDVYKVFLYISVALMLTALILIGVIIARRSIASIDKVDEKYTEKKMTEQWIISFISIIMIIVIINLTIAFTAMLSNLTSTYDENETLLDSVKIYAKAYVRSKSNTSGTSANSNGLGTRTDIDENALDKDGNNLASRMAPSLHGQSINSIHDEDGNPLYLTYLTIPYYDFDGQVQQGEMIVHRDLADEVLLIFQELYNKKYPIQRMELVDNFTNKSNRREADDWTSIQANNTSAFNYRKANNGQTDLDTLSLHAYGKCIDINPLVNPYIVNYWANEDHSGAYTTHRIEDGDNGTNSSPNYNDKFIDREGMKEWDETQKKARIWYDTDILAIFQKYGWDWLDRTGNDTDSQHFQKSDTSSAQTIDWSRVSTGTTSATSATSTASTGATSHSTSELLNLQAKDLFAMGDIAYEHSGDSEGQEAVNYIINTIGSIANIAHAKYPMKRSIVIAQVINESGWVKTPTVNNSEGLDNTMLVRDWNNVLGFNCYDALISPDTTWYKNGAKSANCPMPQSYGWNTSEPVKVFSSLYECIEDWMGQFVYHHPNIDYENYDDYIPFLTGYTSSGWAVKCREIIERYNLERFDSMPNTPVSESLIGGIGSQSIEFNFTTNFEGLYMMESNRDWSKNPWENLFYLICGFVLTVFKALLRGLFICRMIIIAILLAVTPIVLIVNAIMKIKGNNGILKGFAIFYASVLLIKPLLGIIYSIFAKHRPASIADNPFYIMIPVIALTILTIVYFKILAGILSSNK